MDIVSRNPGILDMYPDPRVTFAVQSAHQNEQLTNLMGRNFAESTTQWNTSEAPEPEQTPWLPPEPVAPNPVFTGESSPHRRVTYEAPVQPIVSEVDMPRRPRYHGWSIRDLLNEIIHREMDVQSLYYTAIIAGGSQMPDQVKQVMAEEIALRIQSAQRLAWIVSSMK